MTQLQQNRPVAIVTGASRGIGRGIVTALAREGFDCVVNYARNAAAAEEVGREVESAGGNALLVQADVSVGGDRQRLVAETVGRFGRIDLLVNNAGVAPDVRADILDAGEESFDRLINVNLKGPYFLTQLVARQMIGQGQKEGQGARGKGQVENQSGERSSSSSSSLAPCPLPLAPPFLPKIVTVSSISAYTASVNRGDYCVAKAGLSMMTQLYAARLAEHGINVYEIRPGVIETDMTGPVKAKYDKMILEEGLTPIRRWGKPEDIARAVVAVAKDLFPFSTGEVLNVDGGFHLRRL